MSGHVNIKDIPFEIFGLLRGSNREIHTRVLFMISEMCQERVERVVMLTDLVERMRSERVMSSFEESDVRLEGFVPEDTGKRALNRELAEINLLRSVRLVRRHLRYDASSRDMVMMVFLSSLGLKLVRFLSDVSSDSSDDVKLVNIQNAVACIRSIQRRDPSMEHPYVALKSAHDNIDDFILRLSEFSSDFYDFIDSNPVDVNNVVSAGNWLKRVLGSHYVRDFYELNNYSLGHIARVNEIGHKAALIMTDEDILDWIVSDKVKSEEAISKIVDSNGGTTDRGVIREDVIAMLMRLNAVATNEFGSLIRYLDSVVFDVIRRARYVVLSYIGGENLSSYTTKLAQVIRMYESRGEEPPASLFNIYRCRWLDEQGLRRKPSAAEVIEYDPGAFKTSEVMDIGKPSFFSQRMAAKRYTRRNIPENTPVDVASLPVQDFTDYKELWSMLLLAIQQQPDSAVEILEFMGQVVNGDYSYPGAVIERKAGIDYDDE